MSGYDLALFLHLLALVTAFGASSVVHTAMAKARSASSGREALQWLGTAHALSRVFPGALLVLVGSGAWMTHDGWPWGSGFVVAGLAAVVLLFLSGAAIEGGRARSVAAALASRPDAPVGDEVRDPLMWAASWGNTGVAVGTVFAMTVKPSVAGAIAAVAAGLVLGAVVGLVARNGRARDTAAAPAVHG